MTINVNQIVTLSQSVAKAHEHVEKMKQELQYIQDFSGVGYCSISLSSKQRTVSIDFGQLMEMYEDSLLPALQYVAEQRVKQAEKDLEQIATKLREACGETVKIADNSRKPWYPDLPGWTWHEIEPGTEPNLLDHEIVEVLQRKEREQRQWVSCAAPVAEWIWDCKGEPYEKVAYANKNV